MRGGVEEMKKTDGKLLEAIPEKSMCIPGSGSTVYPRPKEFGDFRHHFISENGMAVSPSLLSQTNDQSTGKLSLGYHDCEGCYLTYAPHFGFLVMKSDHKQ